MRSCPIRSTPRRKVPVVMTTHRDVISLVAPVFGSSITMTPRMRALRSDEVAPDDARSAILLLLDPSSPFPESYSAAPEDESASGARTSIPSPSSRSRASTPPMITSRFSCPDIISPIAALYRSLSI